MTITLNNVGKRFNRDRIFAGINHTFEGTAHTVILGSNGSGKSTLLQIIAGHSSASEGQLTFVHEEKNILPENLFRHISYAAPYMELLEELNLDEHLAFHAGLKPFRKFLRPEEIPALLGLEHARKKELRHYSSGMKQRVKLGLAILSDTALLCLDEPCSNLDQPAINWYQQLIEAHSDQRLILVCSNQQNHEYPFCKTGIRMEDYKN
jgi:ABC-type multidrug transport system ATPase subunit